MDAREIRFRLLTLALPAVGLSLLLLTFYSALDWFVLTPGDWLDEDVTRYWLPLTIALLLHLALVMPRLSQLELKWRNGPFLYNAIALLLIAAPVMMAQAYIGPARGQITHVAEAAMIAGAATTKYYSADRTCLDPYHAAGEMALEDTGSRDGSLNLVLYAAVPVCVPSVKAPADAGNPDIASSVNRILHPDNSADAPTQPALVPGTPHVWITMTFTKGLAGNSSIAERKAAAHDLAVDSQRKVEALDTGKYRYYERVGSRAAQHNYLSAIARAGQTFTPGDVILLPHQDDFAQRTGDWLTWTGLVLGGGTLLWLVMAMLTPLKDDAVDAPVAHAPGWLVPSRVSYGLQTLLGINVLVYLTMMMSGLGVLAFGNEDLIAWGANYGPELHGVGYLRLITSTFVHGGVMHLLNNMYGLVIAGTFLNTLIPNWRLIACYLIAGLGGSITGAVLHPDTISVGASGAILGLWGILIALALLGDVRVTKLGRKALLINGLIFAGLTVFSGSLTPGIDNAAHVGGLATGFLLGAAIWLHGRAGTTALQES